MGPSFDATTIAELSRRFEEPAWMAELRRHAWATHTQLPWPHASDDIWRRTDAALLDPLRGFAPVEPALFSSMHLSPAQFEEWAQPLGREQLAVRANGIWVTPPAPESGITIEELSRAARRSPDPIQRAIEADGLSRAEQKLASLNTAFHHDDLSIQVAPGYSGCSPLRLVRLFAVSSNQAIFPLTVITVGAGSSLTLIDEYISLHATSLSSPTLTAPPTPHLVNSRIELVLEPGATAHYVRLQRWAPNAREFLLQRATLGEGSTLTMANITLGAALSKTHVITKLTGPHASTKLYGFVFGHGRQHVDQHTLQDHQAPHTQSDLQFRAALQDQSHLVYTGLIRIAESAQQTEAFQANHNLLLSQEARAETIPMLEILADDVQCKHGASVGPIDEEQTFYLQSRGLSREAAERLIVMGFIEPIVQQVPFEPLQERLRRELEGVFMRDGADSRMVMAG